jgi:hypothetical protein
MTQLDFIGGLPPPQGFRDIRNTRSSAAEEKAQLCLELGRLCMRPPPGVVNGGVKLTRDWVASQKQGLALARNPRASIPQLTIAVKAMRGFE